MEVQSVSGAMALVELLEFLYSVESDVVGELNVAYDAALAFVQRVHRWLQDLPAVGVSQGHVLAAKSVGNAGMCGYTRYVQ